MPKYSTCSYCGDLIDGLASIHSSCKDRKRQLSTQKIKRTRVPLIIADTETDRCEVPGCQLKKKTNYCYYHIVRARPAPSTAASGYIDYDYKKKLNKDEKDWLNDFTRRYYLNSNAKVLSVKFTQRQQSETFRENHSRRRCVSLNLCAPLTPDKYPASASPEDLIIRQIDESKKKPK